MANRKLSEDEKRQLRDKAKNEILRLEKCLQNEELSKVIDAFKNRFNICESAYKVILAKHQASKGKPPSNILKIDMRQVPNVLKFAGYEFDNQLLTNLFGRKTTSNGHTAKILRNEITHGIDERAVNEIMARKDELFGYMDEFIQIIKTFDLDEKTNVESIQGKIPSLV
ncbi:MAG: hypothetical protein LUG91_10915 [Ruminococcus sp.]|nr:hypothetical protein [Ruminococcus sp.]